MNKTLLIITVATLMLLSKPSNILAVAQTNCPTGSATYCMDPSKNECINHAATNSFWCCPADRAGLCSFTDGPGGSSVGPCCATNRCFQIDGATPSYGCFDGDSLNGIMYHCQDDPSNVYCVGPSCPGGKCDPLFVRNYLNPIYGANPAAISMGQVNVSQFDVDASGIHLDSSKLTVSGIVVWVIKTLLGVIGAAFLIIFLYGCFRFVTSQGDKAAVQGAKGTITNALIGLVLAAAFFAVMSLLQNVVGVNLLRISI